MQFKRAATGDWGAVVWAVAASGKAPAYDYFQELDDRDAAKVQALFNLLAAVGFINNDEKFKKLCTRGGYALWEFKSFQLRFLGTFTGHRQFVVALGLKKKRKTHKSRDLDRAARILDEYLSISKRRN